MLMNMTEGSLADRQAPRQRVRLGLRLRLWRALRKLFSQYRFSSITRRIIVLNLLGVTFLVAGILYLNEGRVKYTQTRVESLTAQAAIIAKAISQASATLSDNSDDGAQGLSDYRTRQPSALGNQELSALSFRINPEIAPMLRDLVGPTHARARIYDADGTLVLDSKQFYTQGQIGRFDNPSLQKRDVDILSRVWTYIRNSISKPDLPIYKEHGTDGKAYDEVRVPLLNGGQLPVIRVTEDGETVISVGMPILRKKAVLGALMLTDQGGDIDAIIASERWQVVYAALFVFVVSGILSWWLAGTIAGPMQRLAKAAERVRKNIKSREQIPDFSHRADEIGFLSRALKDMTNSLYLRIEAIGSFAADVSHELKNPLTSLRNAAALLPKVKSDDDRQKLIDIIQHDVRRLDRLITDISDASRLDAELARENSKPVNMASLLSTLCEVTQESRVSHGVRIVCAIEGCPDPKACHDMIGYTINGHGSRLGQVITNLLENALSFSPVEGAIYVSARRLRRKNQIEITVEDEGPGIRPDNFEKIFQRFYTDRPEHEAFGQNSGLGLNISQQIVQAHMGKIWVENRTTPEPALATRGKFKQKNAGNHHEPANLHESARGPDHQATESFCCGVTARYSYGAKFIIRLPATDATASDARP